MEQLILPGFERYFADELADELATQWLRLGCPITHPSQNIPPAISGASQPKEGHEGSPPSEHTYLHLNSFLQYCEANQRKDDVRDQVRDLRDGQRLRVEKATLLVGFFGLIGLLSTLYVTRAANIIARAAIKQTQDMAQSTDRSWVGVDTVDMKDFEVGKNTRVKIRLRNSGRTPALRVTQKTYYALVRGTPEEPPDISIPISYQSEVVLTPNQTMEVPVVDEEITSIDDFNEVKNKKWTIVVWAVTTYTDRFLTEGKTTLCFFYIPEEAGFYACAKGNDAK